MLLLLIDHLFIFDIIIYILITCGFIIHIDLLTWRVILPLLLFYPYIPLVSFRIPYPKDCRKYGLQARPAGTAALHNDS